MKNLKNYIKESLKDNKPFITIMEAFIIATNNESVIKYLKTPTKASSAEENYEKIIEEFLKALENLTEDYNLALPEEYKEDLEDFLSAFEEALTANNSIDLDYRGFDSFSDFENCIDDYKNGCGDSVYYAEWADNALETMKDYEMFDEQSNTDLNVKEFNKIHNKNFKYDFYSDLLCKLGELAWAQEADYTWSVASDKAEDYYG